MVNDQVSQIQFVIMINNSDPPWEITEADVEHVLGKPAQPAFSGLAKTDGNVDLAFQTLAEKVT